MYSLIRKTGDLFLTNHLALMVYLEGTGIEVGRDLGNVSEKDTFTSDLRRRPWDPSCILDHQPRRSSRRRSSINLYGLLSLERSNTTA